MIGADLVVIGTPTGSSGAVAKAMTSTLDRNAIVTDVGSIKSKVIDDVLPHLPFRGRFVPGHPVAGTENSGPDAAFDTLFVGRHCILTPIAETDPDALATVKALWGAAGSRVTIMTPDHHDQVLAITSHLPHLIAFNIVGTVADLEEHLQTEVLRYSAGGFTDFTRIAGSDPVMWRDIFLHNKDAVLEMLGRFLRGSECVAARDPLGRRRDTGSAFHPHARNPPRRHRRRPGLSTARGQRDRGQDEELIQWTEPSSPSPTEELHRQPSQTPVKQVPPTHVGTWVFGYGSLMWKPGFEYQASGHAVLHGYHRSLCVYSWVHRGTREQPGLVFGLDRGGACKGFAFQVTPEQEEEVLAYLDARELVTNVYRRKWLSITIGTETGAERVPAWCYVVRRDHPQYAGRLSEDELIAVIERGHGRSGNCRDYVLSTVDHLDELGVHDAVLKSVARRLAERPA